MVLFVSSFLISSLPSLWPGLRPPSSVAKRRRQKGNDKEKKYLY